ncbi:MAG: hypothetical protein FWD97_02360 [Defluviitaleaceae bacterium]|nr:hypothetical protein [Defluviitaleaceae bacterium]
MFYFAIGLFVVSLIVSIADIFVEGFGPLAIIGLVGVAVSLVLVAVSSPIGGWIVLGKVMVTVPGLWMLWRFLRKRQLDGRFILSETLAEDTVDVGGLEYFIGKEGVTTSALRPQGFADFNGTKIEVSSEAGYIDVDKRIKVVDVQNRRVFVKLAGN